MFHKTSCSPVSFFLAVHPTPTGVDPTDHPADQHQQIPAHLPLESWLLHRARPACNTAGLSSSRWAETLYHASVVRSLMQDQCVRGSAPVGPVFRNTFRALTCCATLPSPLEPELQSYSNTERIQLSHLGRTGSADQYLQISHQSPCYQH